MNFKNLRIFFAHPLVLSPYLQAQSAMVGPDELAMWADFGERTVILWADTEQHIKVRITFNTPK